MDTKVESLGEALPRCTIYIKSYEKVLDHYYREVRECLN